LGFFFGSDACPHNERPIAKNKSMATGDTALKRLIFGPLYTVQLNGESFSRISIPIRTLILLKYN